VLKNCLKTVTLLIILSMAILLTGCGEESSIDTKLTQEKSIKETKEQSAKFVRSFILVDKVLSKQQKQVTEVVQAIASGSVSSTKGYLLLQQLEESMTKLYGDIIVIPVPGDDKSLSDIKDAYQYSTISIKQFAKGVMAYMDDNKTSTLAEAQKSFEDGSKLKQMAVISLATKAVELNIDIGQNNSGGENNEQNQ